MHYVVFYVNTYTSSFEDSRQKKKSAEMCESMIKTTVEIYKKIHGTNLVLTQEFSTLTPLLRDSEFQHFKL